MVKKEYSQATLDALQTKIEKKDYHGVTAIYKGIPETDIKGAMDPRVLKGAKKMALMMKFIPKKKKDAMFADLTNLRPMFAGVKSIPVTRDDMQIDELEVDGTPIRIYHPQKQDAALPVLYYIHGGGFFGGSMDVVHEACKMITDMHPCITVSVDYRLAPENPYPAGHEDCYKVLKWIYENIDAHGGDKEKIAVSGDSAGGNLCIYCGYRNKEEAGHMVKALIPYYPTVNMCTKKDDILTYDQSVIDIYPKQKKYIASALGMFESLNVLGDVLGSVKTDDPYLSPYQADLTGMPPTLLMVGEHDFLSLETMAFAAKLQKAGVETALIIYRGMGHAFLDQVGVAPQAEDSLIELSRFLAKIMG